MDLINTSMSRVTCPNVENPENQAVQFWVFRVKMPKFDRPGFGHSTCQKVKYNSKKTILAMSEIICPNILVST